MFLCVWMFHSGRGRIRTCVTEFRCAEFRSIPHRALKRWGGQHWNGVRFLCLYCLSYFNANDHVFVGTTFQSSNLKPHLCKEVSVIYAPVWEPSGTLSTVPTHAASTYKISYFFFTILFSSPSFMYWSWNFLRNYLYFEYLFVCDNRYVTILLSCTTINASIITELCSPDWYYIIAFTFFHTIILSISLRV